MGKMYKCPYCNNRYERSKLSTHINRVHSEMIPEGFTADRLVFNYINNTTGSLCRICKEPTPWNEKTGRYGVLCGKQSCKDAMREEYKKNMLRVKGTYNILNDPEQQKIMLANRKISGEYKFSDGGKVSYTGTYEKACLEFMDVVMQIPSTDIMSPGPSMEYIYNGSKHIYIPDFYYIPYNLIIEVKDGGDNPNNKRSIGMDSSREKTIEKERIITDKGIYNYVRLTNNNFQQLLLVFMDLKERSLNGDTSKGIYINEACKDIDTTKKFVSEVKNLADRYNANFFIVTDRCHNLDSNTFMIENDNVMNETTRNKQYIFNKVYYIDDNTVLIQKNNLRVIVAKDNKYTIVFDPDTMIDDYWFNCLAHKKPTTRETYEKWLHVIGKMISKNTDSKYFGNHKFEEHMINGNCTEEDYSNIIRLQKRVMKNISSIRIRESSIHESIFNQYNNDSISDTYKVSDNTTFKDIKDFNSFLNKWDYGVLIKGKKYSDLDEVTWNDYRTTPVAILDKERVGVCWDFVNYQSKWFKDNDIKYKAYLIAAQMSEDKNNLNTHTFNILDINGTLYWFESSWQSQQGLHKVSSVFDVVNVFKEHYKNWYSLCLCEYDPTGLDKNLNGSQFLKKASKNLIFFIKNKEYKKPLSEAKYNYRIDDDVIYTDRDTLNGIPLYRITIDGVGIYEAFRKRVDYNIWRRFLASSSAKWLPHPEIRYTTDLESYFTELGYEKFKEETLPVLSKYFNKKDIDVEVIYGLPGRSRLIYKDLYQVIIKK